ncbi:MAG: hypothetical protein M1814_003665 [Vezdaea aestivalis]|nr:MAG: hypothetical protein M1814_003665 [Vezdaea aestivalis]
MRLWLSALAASALFPTSALANEVKIDHTESGHQQCSGMFDKSTWGGAVNPHIQVVLEKYEGDADPLVSLIIFEWHDEPLVGQYANPTDPEPQYICNGENVDRKLCTEEQLGQWILANNATTKSKNKIFTQATNLKDVGPIKYEVKKTGYYCVIIDPYTAEQFKGVVSFRNAFGELPAAQIAKLPFYGGLTITYAVVGFLWAFLYVQHRHDILAVQNYITAIVIFLIVEMLMTWGFYDYQNRHGRNALANVLMIIVSILNAGRNSFSFFLLLIVCMGYGVVKHTLGKTMLMVRGLALGHFVFGVIYAVASLTITPESAGPLVLLVILPLAGTLTAFYVWTLNSLSATMKDLIDRKQTVKAMMYKKLWWGILGSIMVIFGFFFLNSFTFAGHSQADFVPTHWKTRWFILDGWLNLVYLFDICFVAYLWRPTANNRRFAMSDEIAQDDEFEFASVRNSLDEESGSGGHTPLPQGGASAPNGAAASQYKAPKPRESLEAEETIFAVGEEEGDADRWSEDGDSPRDSSEKKRLTGGKDK